MIQLDENYRIEPDAASWNLVYEKIGDINPETGKPKVSREASYHMNLRQALSKYSDECLKRHSEPPQAKVTDLIKAIDRIEATIREVTK